MKGVLGLPGSNLMHFLILHAHGQVDKIIVFSRDEFLVYDKLRGIL